jgi:hypothetical protein
MTGVGVQMGSIVMNNYMGFVYSMTIAAREKYSGPMSEQEIILRERAEDAPEIARPGMGLVIRGVLGSIARAWAALRARGARRVEQTG